MICPFLRLPSRACLTLILNIDVKFYEFPGVFSIFLYKMASPSNANKLRQGTGAYSVEGMVRLSVEVRVRCSWFAVEFRHNFCINNLIFVSKNATSVFQYSAVNLMFD